LIAITTTTVIVKILAVSSREDGLLHLLHLIKVVSLDIIAEVVCISEVLVSSKARRITAEATVVVVTTLVVAIGVSTVARVVGKGLLVRHLIFEFYLYLKYFIYLNLLLFQMG
jgi:hypothetical protein